MEASNRHRGPELGQLPSVRQLRRRLAASASWLTWWQKVARCGARVSARPRGARCVEMGGPNSPPRRLCARPRSWLRRHGADRPQRLL